MLLGIRLALVLILCSVATAACDPGPGGGPTPPPGPTSTPSSSLGVTPNSVQLSGVGSANAQAIAVQESGYSGRFGENDTCSGIAMIAAESMNGPTASYTVTGVAAGSCNVTFSDTFGQRQAVPVSVTTSGFNVQ